MIAGARRNFAGAESTARASWTAFGLALILAGQPIGWWVRGTFTASESPAFPAVVVLFGLLLIAFFGWDRPARLYIEPRIYALPMLLIIAPFVALAVVEPTLMATEISYLVFMMSAMLTLAMVPLRRLSGLLHAVILVGTTSCVLALLSLITNPVEGVLVRLTVAGNDNTIVVGNIGVTVIIASFCLAAGRHISRPASILLALGVAIALICVILSNTKSAILGLVLALPVAISITAHEQRQDGEGPWSSLRALSVLLSLFAGLAVFILLSVIDVKTIQALATDFIDRISGAFALFESDRLAVPDQSSRERLTFLSEFWRKATPGGLGISNMARDGGAFELPGTYPHNSYLQILYDLGSVPLAVYTIVILIVPAVLMIKRVMVGRVTSLEAFVVGFFVFKQVDLLTHSTPYDWLNLISMMLVYVVFARSRAPSPIAHGAALAR